MAPSSNSPKIVFCCSGEGNLFESAAKEVLASNMEVVGLLTQNAQAGCVLRAQSLNIPVFTLESNKSLFADSLTQTLEKLQPDVIVLAGFTRKIPDSIVSQYKGRIVNSHPSLLPKYGGKGMYGRFVHEAVLKSGDLVTGITVHLVTQDYDEGPVIAQKEIPIQPGEALEDLENRVKRIEREFFPQALKEWLSRGR